jgi:hypothetical protein
MSQITIQCRLVACEPTRQQLWTLMAERNTPLINELLAQISQHPDFETWRQQARLKAGIAKGRRKRAEGFYVYYWYLVISAIKSVLTFMATAISSSNCVNRSKLTLASAVNQGGFIRVRSRWLTTSTNPGSKSNNACSAS